MHSSRAVGWGIRARITVVATVVMIAVLVGTATALVVVQRSVLTDSVDEVLSRHSAAIEQQLGDGPPPVMLRGQGDDESFAMVVAASGEVVAATPDAPADAFSSPPGSRPRFESVLVGTQSFRVRVQSIDAGDRFPGAVAVVGTPLDDVDDSVSALTSGLAVTVPLVSALLGLLVWLVVGRVLRPVEEIRGQVARITANNLDARVPEPPGHDEIARLAVTMNDMLDRLEAASVRQRAFIADASHELRSPLARIRSELEVDLAHPVLADVRVTQLSALAEIEGLQRLVDDLLLLARTEGTVARGHDVVVDLDDVVFSELDLLRASTGVTVDASQVTGAQASGNVGQFARIVRNLLDNAVRHGRPPISVRLGEGPDGADLVVDDCGAGFPPGLGDRAFERFTRADEARSASGGAGLGLAIARELVWARGGNIDLGSNPSGGARVTVRLPRVDT